MADFYPYLVASLPLLRFGMKPPFSFAGFLDVCCPLIPEDDGDLLRALPLPADYAGTVHRDPVIRKWVAFDTAVRNELVRVRAGSLHRDPAEYLREGGTGSPPQLPPGIAAALQSSPLDAERALDEVRWKALDELATGHSFDLAVLITYAYKLLVLERWETIRGADGAALLGQALGSSGGTV